MKKIITYIAALLLVLGCSKGVDDGSQLFAYGEGGVALSFGLPSTRATDDDYVDKILTNSVLKVYSVAESGETTLVRRYEPATEMPSTIHLAAGDYKATLWVGDKSIVVTQKADELCYYGESDLEIVASQSSTTTLECDMCNSILEVNFEDSIAENFAEGYSLSVVASNEGGFTETIYEESDIKSDFTMSGSRYLLLYGEDAPTKLLWQFKGQRVIEGVLVDDTPITICGKVNAPAPQEKSMLTFKYSNYLEFSSELITINYSTEDFDDTLHFSPQPAITPVGFALTEILSAENSYSFNIRGLRPLSSCEIKIDNKVVSGGYTFTIDSADSAIGSLTLPSDLFAGITGGESSTIEITAIDENYGEGSVEVTVARSGVSALSNIDYWQNSAKVSGLITGAATNVSFDYRTSGSAEWLACGSTTVTETGGYEAMITPTWSGALANGSYNLLSGIMAGNTYEVRMTADGVEYTREINAGGTRHTITDPVDGASCYKSSGSDSKNSTTWASGNNDFAKSLCAYDSATNGSLLAATAAGLMGINRFAAGNLVYGQFNFNGISKQTGTMSFGQKLDWVSRPKSFKFTYKATIGKCNWIENDSLHPLKEGSIDPACIYFAIVDWSSRHQVTAGKGAPSGSWSPATHKEVGEGKVIGYAILDITASTSGFNNADIEICYYDKTTKPSGNITIVVSATTSVYGDYLSGSTDNRLWLSGFGLGY